MTSRTRPSLNRDAARARASVRNSVVIDGRCSIGEREAQDVIVTDLSPSGCRLRGVAVGVIKSEPVVLWLGEVGPVAGRLKWTKGGALGVSFDAPLEAALLDALCDGGPTSNVVPLRP